MPKISIPRVEVTPETMGDFQKQPNEVCAT